MAKTDTPDPFRIGIVPINGFALMSYAAVTEPLRAANLLAKQAHYQVVNLPADGQSATASGGAAVGADAAFGGARDYDLVLVVAGGNATDYRDRKLANWLRVLARNGVQIGGVSAGPLFLAREGLLADRRMTVHWEHEDQLREQAPDILFERSLYVIDRDRMTCGGGTAPMDMMLALIARHHGQEFATLVGDWFLHTSIRPPGGPQRASLTERYGTANAAVLSAIEAMENHLADPLSLHQLAQIAGTSPRQLSRLFNAALGVTPIGFCRRLRLEKAHAILQYSSINLSEVALMTGFSSAAHFSSVYAKRYGIPPSNARR